MKGKTLVSLESKIRAWREKQQDVKAQQATKEKLPGSVWSAFESPAELTDGHQPMVSSQPSQDHLRERMTQCGSKKTPRRYIWHPDRSCFLGLKTLGMWSRESLWHGPAWAGALVLPSSRRDREGHSERKGFPWGMRISAYASCLTFLWKTDMKSSHK